MFKFMPSCQEVTRKLAQGDFERNPLTTRLVVKAHLLMCRHCGRFARQLKLIDQSLRELWSGKPESDKLEAIKRRVLSRLRQISI